MIDGVLRCQHSSLQYTNRRPFSGVEHTLQMRLPDWSRLVPEMNRVFMQ